MTFLVGRAVLPDLVFDPRVTLDVAQLVAANASRGGRRGHPPSGHGRIGSQARRTAGRAGGPDRSRAAHHFVREEAWPKAVEYLVRAADKARRSHAYAEGARSCEEAIRISDEHGGAREALLDALERLGDLQSLLGQVEAANAAYDRAAALAAPGPAGRRLANKRHQQRFATRDGARIAYYDHGSGQTTLLVRAGATYGIEHFQPLIEALCQDFRIITMDPRGGGASDPLDHPFTRREHALDCAAVIEAAGPGPAVFLGVSDAGRIGIHLATARPDLVRGLVLIATPHAPGSVYAADLAPGFFAPWVEAREAGDFRKLGELNTRSVFTEPGCRPILEARLTAQAALSELALRSFFNPDDPGIDVRPLLAGLSVPTLVLHGDEDRLVPLSCARYFAAHIRGARLHVFAGRCHALIYTATAELVEVVRDFLA